MFRARTGCASESWEPTPQAWLYVWILALRVRGVGMKAVGSEQYLSVDQLAERIPYKPKTIRNLMSRGVFIEGIHFTRLTGRPIFLWSRVEQLLREGKNERKGQG